MTKPEFEAMVARFPYYKNRWGYMSAALAQATALIGRHGLRTALELGAPVLPIIVGADVMDKKARPELDPSVSIRVFDATQVPWPVDDKAYDLFMALQVFEHLDGSPARSLPRSPPDRPPRDPLAADRLGDGGPAQLPPPDLERARAVVVRSDRPDPDRPGDGRAPPTPDLRVRGSARPGLRPARPARGPLRTSAGAPAPSWS